MPSTRPSTAESRSASSKTMNGDLPPSSSDSFLRRTCGCLADDSTDFSRTGKRDLVDVVVFDKKRPVRPSPLMTLRTPGGRPISSGEFSESKSRKRRVLGGLDDDRISSGQRRSDLPREHQQREVPRNHLSNDATGGVACELALQQLRPSGVMIEVARDERNIDIAALTNRLAIVDRSRELRAVASASAPAERVHTDSALADGRSVPATPAEPCARP